MSVNILLYAEMWTSIYQARVSYGNSTLLKTSISAYASKELSQARKLWENKKKAGFHPIYHTGGEFSIKLLKQSVL